SFALLLPHPMRVTSTPLSFFPRPSPPELYTLSLHDALPISSLLLLWRVTRFSSVRHVNTEHGDGGMNRSRLSRQRSAAGHSQESLAEALAMDRTTIGRWERGVASPQPWVRQLLADELSVSMRELDDLLSYEVNAREVRTSPTACSQQPEVTPDAESNVGRWEDNAIPLLRRLIDTYDIPQDGPDRSLQWLRQSVSTVVTWRLNAKYARIADTLPQLIPELTRAAFAGSESACSEAFALLAQTYRAADAIADKLGFSDLSARIID